MGGRSPVGTPFSVGSIVGGPWITDELPITSTPLPCGTQAIRKMSKALLIAGSDNSQKPDSTCIRLPRGVSQMVVEYWRVGMLSIILKPRLGVVAGTSWT